MGRRNRPYYRLVVADSRARRDGRFIELLGSYDPMKPKAERTVLNEDRILYWLDKGASPSNTVRNLLSDNGILLKAHLADPNLSDAQRSEQIQKYELSKQARLKKDEPATARKTEAAAPAAEESAAPADVAADTAETAETPAENENQDNAEAAAEEAPETAETAAPETTDNEDATDTDADSTEAADSQEEKPAAAGE